MQIKKVRIVKGYGWYTDKVGDIIEVAEIPRPGHKYGHIYVVADDYFKKFGEPDKFVRLFDAEEYREPHPVRVTF